jgi:hypothetical protein
LADGAKRLRAMFKGGRAQFSEKAKRTITVSSLAATGASDYGIQSIIFGTLKAVTEEIGLDLSNDELASGTPDVTSLKNWEFSVASGCMASVIREITIDAEYMKEKYDKKLQISLVTDHGNRSGVDHFVKMIIWSTKRNGKWQLHHFNLDIDKGGHTTISAANAIHKSLLRLHVEQLDIEFSFICGDSGGGARVQLLHPLLIEIGAMDQGSDHINCLLHAFNLAYEHACKDALGDQGMNRCTVFQMCYLAILS